MNKLPTISEAEYEVMKIIWAHAPISTTEVVERLLETSTWTPKTIQSLLARLVKKGALEYQKNGRVFVYTPLVKEEEYLEKESVTFLNRFYNGALNSMVVNFLKHDKLTKDDIEELKKILDERLIEGE
ncbi:MAG: BlaI/MecI/CopY family transcriptional regulator [Clostridiales bacterium]|nr:BlaI/MecI/CopY family transcriptional regulator [Clostridiales bacterium]MDU6975285.1 BlaI/MecI/CopY family transcriptional regulator [Clostridiales bacterium]